MNLEDRIKAYESDHDHKLMDRVPVIIKIDGIGFEKLTRQIPKPFCLKTSKTFGLTTIECVKQIDGAIFGFNFNDEIYIVTRNDQNVNTDPWLGNKIQKIASTSASIATLYFNKFLDGDSSPNINSHALFRSSVFTLPNVTEVINFLIAKQHTCTIDAINNSLYTELTRKYDKQKAFKMLQNRSAEERVLLLQEECGIDFYDDYPFVFRNGLGVYKTPKVVDTASGETTVLKWVIDAQMPSFLDDKAFIFNIIYNGADIFKPQRDMPE